MDDLDNDDANEHRARRLSRRAFADIENLQSPNAIERVTPSYDAGMNNKEVAEHYGDCIKLAAENKITAKNAFQLHLIDYMNDMLNRISVDNFQMASSSLDASAKIYAGRVDAVHQEAYKVLTGLGRSDKNASQADNQDDDDAPHRRNDNLPDFNDDENVEDDPRKKRLKEARERKRRNIILKNMNKIRLKSITLQCDVDPLFQQQAAAYDEGGTAELRLNRVHVLDNSSELILDSGVKIFDRLSSDSEAVEHLPFRTCKVDDMFSSLFTSLILTATEVKIEECLREIRPVKFAICQEFRKFDFCDTAPLNKANINDSSDSNCIYPQDVINIDPICEEPIDAEHSDNEAFEPLDHESHEPNDGDNISEDRTSVYLGENNGPLTTDFEEIHKKYSDEGINKSCSEFVTGLREMIGEQLDKYGGLTDNLLGMWAGPSLWRSKLKKQQQMKMNPRVCENRENGNEVGQNGKDDKKRINKKKKLTELLTFCENLNDKRNWSKEFYKCKKTSTTLSDPTLVKYTKKKNKVPQSDIDKRDVFGLMTKEVNLISKRIESSSQDVANIDEDLIKCYNFDNPLDANEFCPSHEGGDVGFNDDEDDDEDAIGHSFDGAFAFLNEGNGAEVDPSNGNNIELVSQPRHIAKIDIDYARVAKRINIKSVKTAMWSYLAPSSLKPQEKNNTSGRDRESSQYSEDISVLNNSAAEMSETKRLTDLLEQVPNLVSRQTCLDLSAPVMVACLLYLSNEKELYLESTADFNDLIISQSLPQIEIDTLREYARLSAKTSAEVEEQRRQSLKKRVKKRQSLLDHWLDADDNEISS